MNKNHLPALEEIGPSPFAADLRAIEERRRGGSDTHMHPNRQAGEDHSGIVLEPISAQPYFLSYACLLIPRFGNHSLAGDIVDFLYHWMSQVSISFGWQLESVDVQSDHMQWSLNAPATVPPAHFIRLVRRYTSKQIFDEFPRYKKENIANDFWAPGHLVIVGKRAHSPEMIAEFIRLTRQQQGAAFLQHG
jgi:REP element-mobilizing transposase RayT